MFKCPKRSVCCNPGMKPCNRFLHLWFYKPDQSDSITVTSNANSSKLRRMKLAGMIEDDDDDEVSVNPSATSQLDDPTVTDYEQQQLDEGNITWGQASMTSAFDPPMSPLTMNSTAFFQSDATLGPSIMLTPQSESTPMASNRPGNGGDETSTMYSPAKTYSISSPVSKSAKDSFVSRIATEVPFNTDNNTKSSQYNSPNSKYGGTTENNKSVKTMTSKSQTTKINSSVKGSSGDGEPPASFAPSIMSSPTYKIIKKNKSIIIDVAEENSTSVVMEAHKVNLFFRYKSRILYIIFML